MLQSWCARSRVVQARGDAAGQAWRVLSRLHGAELCYTPMIHAAMFADDAHEAYRRQQFDMQNGEEGEAQLDRPLFVQFCANDEKTFLQAAARVGSTRFCDAIDLNVRPPSASSRKLSGQHSSAARKASRRRDTTAPFLWKTGRLSSD